MRIASWMGGACLGVVAGLSGDAPAVAQTTEEPLAAERLEWARRPTGQDFARVYPQRAWYVETEGQADVICRITEALWLTDCRIETESPEGYGFGAAAAELAAKRWKLAAQQTDPNVRPQALVRVKQRFRLPRR